MHNLLQDGEDGIREIANLGTIPENLNQTNKQHHDSLIALLQRITRDRNKINDMIFIMSAAYDEIHKKYNTISLCVLVLSSLTTLIEASRLGTMDYINDKDSNESIKISFILNLLI